MNIWRVGGVALMAGLALFLVSLLLKFLLIGLATLVLVRVIGRQIANRSFGAIGRGRWASADVISIDNPAYRSGGSHLNYGRIIPVS